MERISPPPTTSNPTVWVKTGGFSLGTEVSAPPVLPRTWRAEKGCGAGRTSHPPIHILLPCTDPHANPPRLVGWRFLRLEEEAWRPARRRPCPAAGGGRSGGQRRVRAALPEKPRLTDGPRVAAPAREALSKRGGNVGDQPRVLNILSPGSQPAVKHGGGEPNPSGLAAVLSVSLCLSLEPPALVSRDPTFPFNKLSRLCGWLCCTPVLEFLVTRPIPFGDSLGGSSQFTP